MKAPTADCLNYHCLLSRGKGGDVGDRVSDLTRSICIVGTSLKFFRKNFDYYGILVVLFNFFKHNCQPVEDFACINYM